ncbi:alpha/beta hydrolase fold domain-containing protein [Nocardia huaxiensis]|uniref:alpha/beta hydrolase fold domain-containing protein n=1 Tax=Nocardia huaxiensis TaxID=2755382 RepID=UPI001E456CBB|nr:alpha/beta hydrolase [Nocardia huaxiensis]UFS96208.1 alpha/beta hydrolase [Nocardia huaxiensis]
MPSFLSRRVMPGYLRVTRANRAYIDTERARAHVRENSIRPQPYAPPRRLRSDVAIEVSREAGFPVYTLTPRSGRTSGSVVYIHGGGWVNEIKPQHWALAADIAARAATTVTVPVYPLIPFGTAGQVVPAMAKLVADNVARYGAACLAGDSAGGQITLSAAVLLRDEQQLKLPRTVLISPALDQSLRNPEIDVVQPSDPWLGKAGARVFIEYWRGDLPVDDPLVSPLAADLPGLGPLTIFCGTRDIVHPDTKLLVAKARAAGVEVDYHEGRDLLHVYPLTPTPEGKVARRLIVERIREALVHTV